MNTAKAIGTRGSEIPNIQSLRQKVQKAELAYNPIVNELLDKGAVLSKCTQEKADITLALSKLDVKKIQQILDDTIT